jgi:predicted helicase
MCIRDRIKSHIIQTLGKQAYLWHETPETLLINQGIIGCHNDGREIRLDRNPHRDTGIDIIQVDADGTCSLVQCKNGYKAGLTLTDVGSFLGWMFKTEHKAREPEGPCPPLRIGTLGYLYFTDKISTNLANILGNPRLQCIKHPFVEPNIQTEPVGAPEIVPRDYQLDAVAAFSQPFNRGILSMPCGTGKTLVS